MANAPATRPTIELSILIADPFDGMVRLLNDVQRFGLGLVGTAMQEHAGGYLVSLVLTADDTVDQNRLAIRLTRHSSVLWAAATESHLALPRAA